MTIPRAEQIQREETRVNHRMRNPAMKGKMESKSVSQSAERSQGHYDNREDETRRDAMGV